MTYRQTNQSRKYRRERFRNINQC